MSLADADRAGDIIGRIRDHFKKAPPKMDRFDMNEAIRDAITLTRGEAVNNGVSVQMQLAEGLPFFRGDRVQIQQVMVNLIVNAIQAMSGGGDGRRELQISTEIDEAEGVRVGVREPARGCRRKASRVCSSHSTRPSPRGWAWASRSAARSSKPMAEGCGRSHANRRVLSFSLQSLPPERT